MDSTTGPERFDKLYGDIPGSKPDWRGSNVKTKGKAAVEYIPPARLGETGWAAWTSFQDLSPGFGRRHYHNSPLTQTVAKASLPCVEASAAASCSTNLQLSGSLAAAYQEQRRYRRMISTPPEKIRPQGKKMVAKQQAGASAAAVCVHSGSSAPGIDRPSACSLQHKQQQQQQHVLSGSSPDIISNSAAGRSSTGSAAPTSGNNKSSVGDCHCQCLGDSSSSSNVAVAWVTTAAAVVPAAGDVNSGRTGVPPRVQDNPDYFRTLKDPPAFQRFCASVAARNPAKPESSSTAARHEHGLQQKQHAALELARREVAALQMPGL